MVDRIYELVTRARSSVDITSLLPATGRYRTALIHALVYLDNIGARPDVRMLYGTPGDGHLFRVLELRSPIGANELADAVLRGVTVEIIKSHGTPSTVTGYNMVSAENTFDALGRTIERRAGSFNPLRPKGHYIPEVCERVHLTALRASEPAIRPSLSPLHGKFIMVDDASFYVGSHNIYPSNLAEYGNIVFSSAASSVMLQNYWLPAWSHSLLGLVPCRLPLLGG
jgi:phosphatidylserine/phosphatidylglycerophosphate/cardiolipin synthase-like enzyme